MKRVGAEMNRSELLFTHLDPLWIFVRVQLALYLKASSSCGRRDQIDDYFMAYQRFAAPVFRYERE